MSSAAFLMGKSHLIVDRDTKYTAQFRRLIAESRTAVIRLPPRSPNLNAYAERFVRSIKEECLDRMIFVGQGSLRRAVTEFVAHYHHERNHQGLGNRLIQPEQRSSARGCVSLSTSATRWDAQLLLSSAPRNSRPRSWILRLTPPEHPARAARKRPLAYCATATVFA